MSDSDLLSRYARPGESERDPRLDAEASEDLGVFGWYRGVRERALMLELRKKTGDILAVGYGWLERAEFNPSQGITLHLVGQKIQLVGRNLNLEVRPRVRLFEGITRHRVPWVREASEAELIEAPEGMCLIETITWG